MKPEGPISCHEFAEHSADYLDGALAGTERERFEEHARSCARCGTYLMDIRRVIDATGRLRGSAAGGTDPARAAAVELFRTRGLHGQGAQVRDVPLGIGKHSAALGDHIAYLWESESEFLATVGYLATGLKREEACLLLGRDQANQRVLQGLDHLGLNTSDLRREDRLHVASPSSSSDDLLRAVDDRVKSAVDRGLVGVRVLGDMAWGVPGWPTDKEILKLEACVTGALRRLPCIVLCTYDARRLPANASLKHGLECHPAVLHRETIEPNAAYVPAERFLASLDDTKPRPTR